VLIYAMEHFSEAIIAVIFASDSYTSQWQSNLGNPDDSPMTYPLSHGCTIINYTSISKYVNK